MRTIYFIISLLMLGGSSWAQNPVPAPPQSQPIAITGATAHLGNGEVIENALITFAEGKITGVGPLTNRSNLDGHQVIDASGKHVYPGFIAPNTQLGLVEIGAVRSTRDDREVGQMNPNVRSLIAFNTDSQVIPTVRSRGVLYAQATPLGGTISGSSSIMQLDGWNWEDAAVQVDDGIHINWPRRFSWSWQTRELGPNRRFGEQVEALKAFIREAQAYCAVEHATENLKLRSMCNALSGDQQVYIHANLAKDIEQAILLGQEYGFKIVIVGGRDSYMITDLLKANDIPVVLGPTHDMPGSPDADVDQPFKTPAMLHEAGVRFALGQDGSWQQRNLPFLAGTAVAYGLPYEAAIQALTQNTADIMGLGEQMGSLETGKTASLFISSGDALDMRTSVIERAFIDGRDINLDNKQAYLYRKFGEKYERSR